MKPPMLSVEQVRLSCQADAFLRVLVCEKFKPKGDVDFHVGLHPIADGVRMHLGIVIQGHSFIVGKPFGVHTGTSQLFFGCEEMVVELTRSIEDVTHEMKREDLVTDENTEYTRANWPNEWAPPRGLDPDLGDLTDWTPSKDELDEAPCRNCGDCFSSLCTCGSGDCVDCCNCPNGRCSIVPDDDEIEDDFDDSDYDDDNIGGEHAPY